MKLKTSVAVACLLPGRVKDLLAHLLKPHCSNLPRSSSRSVPRFHLIAGVRGVFLVLLTPSRYRTSCIRLDTIFLPWSLCRSIGTPKRKKLDYSKSATVDAYLGMSNLLAFGDVVHGDQCPSVSPVSLSKGKAQRCQLPSL
jgi:hypothetical protein